MIQKTEEKNYFGGKIANFKNKYEAHFENKHLKAFLKGAESFRYQFDKEHKPLWFPVLRSETPVV